MVRCSSTQPLLLLTALMQLSFGWVLGDRGLQQSDEIRTVKVFHA
jgi:hypothetical protein